MTKSPNGNVTLAIADSVATILFSRPGKKNSLTAEMLGRFEGIVASLEKGNEARVAVLRGEGGTFIAGADLNIFASLGPGEARAFAERGQAVLSRLENLPLPVLAAVEGPCLGGGLEFALACDIILASETALFAAPEVARGISVGWGGSVRLPRRVGMGRAKDMIFTGRMVSASEALAMGLAEAVYPSDRFGEEVAAYAGDLAEKAPIALALVKSSVLRGWDASLEAGLALEREAFAYVFSTEDAGEGVRAFLEKRPPRFRGR